MHNYSATSPVTCHYLGQNKITKTRLLNIKIIKKIKNKNKRKTKTKIKKKGSKLSEIKLTHLY